MTKILRRNSGFEPVRKHGKNITPFVRLVEIHGFKSAKLSYAGHNAEQLEKLREAGAFNLSPKINYCGDAIRNGNIAPNVWFFSKNNTEDLFRSEIARHPESKIIISTNAGNAPLHDWELNYAADQSEPLASKDFEKDPTLFGRRDYYCVSYGPKSGIGIGYQTFSEFGNPKKNDIEVAVGGRPLVHAGEAVPLEEILATSITDPRHVIMFPEIYLGDKNDIPIGIRSIQEMLRNNQAAEIIEKIKANEFIRIDLKKEKECLGKITKGEGKEKKEYDIQQEDFEKAFTDFGLKNSDFDLNFTKEKLLLRFQLNSYRHTFWAKKAETLFMGIVNNDLEVKDEPLDDFLYKKVLKSVGLTIPQLQEFLIDTLKVEEAVLMGNGKDPRIYISEHPHTKEFERIHDHDNDVKRSSITAGMVSLVI